MDVGSCPAMASSYARSSPDDFRVSLSVTTLGGDQVFHHEDLELKEANVLMGIYLRNGINRAGCKRLARGEVIVRVFAETA
jgi:hypothetical protein